MLAFARVTVATAAAPPAALAARFAFGRSLIRIAGVWSRRRWPRHLRPGAHAFGIASLRFLTVPVTVLVRFGSAATVAILVAIAIVVAFAIPILVVAMVGSLAMITAVASMAGPLLAAIARVTAIARLVASLDSVPAWSHGLTGLLAASLEQVHQARPETRARCGSRRCCDRRGRRGCRRDRLHCRRRRRGALFRFGLEVNLLRRLPGHLVAGHGVLRQRQFILAHTPD
jgi:hypothetical protein